MDEERAPSEQRFEASDLESFVRSVLLAVGVVDDQASIVAEALVRADLRGVSSHGVARLETYVHNFEEGGFNPDPEVTVDKVADSVVRVDADDGLGQPAGLLAMDEAITMAADTGLGMALVRNSNHFGTAAFYTQHATTRDCIGMAMTNVDSGVVPFGGAQAFLGTNPISFAIPTDRSFPITLDMATSAVAMGKIDHPPGDGLTIPPEWAVDETGTPTTDPESVAALQPVGGPKGYGLGLVVDVLCSLLTGARPSSHVGALYDDFDEPMRLGHCMMAIDIASLMDPDAFRSSMGTYIDELKAINTQPGVDEVLLPGEPEARDRHDRGRNGIPVSPDSLASLERLAMKYDLQMPVTIKP